ncbi:MAG TPA: hypothetical protein ENI69_09835 [Rhodospirillales bacterium]|nr:hypothetical protein [Rhodospirillales bacterium]
MGVSKRVYPDHASGSLLELRGLFVGLLLASVLSSPSALAGQWTANFSTLTSATYNDNPTLATDNQKGRMDFTVNRAIDGEYAKDRYRIAIVGQANVVASKDEIVNSIFAADQVRYDLNMDGEYDFDTSVIAAAFGIGFDTVQNTEFDDTGTLTSDVTKTNTSFGLSYNRELNEQWSLNFSDNVAVVSYSGGGFTGYSNNSALVGLSHAYSERLTITPSIGFSRYQPDSNLLKASNTLRLQVGGDYQLSENDSLGGAIGVLQTDGNLGWSALLNYEQEVLEGLTASASVNRDNIPSSNGNIRQSTGLDGGVTYQLTEIMRVGINAAWRISSQVGATGSADTTQLTLSPSANWTLSEKWRASFSAQNRSQKKPNSGTATSRSVTFALDYNLPLE